MAGLIDFLRLIVKALTPTDDPDPKAQLAWRKAVAGCLMGVIVAVVLSFLWAQGRIPGLSGVALAADLTALDGRLSKRQDNLERGQNALLLISVRNGIKQALKDRCHAIYAKNGQALDAANSDLDAFSDQYRALTGLPYNAPDCSVILIANTPPDP